MNIADIIRFAQERGYETAEKLNDWNGFECYEPIMDSKEISEIGPPLIILVKGEEIRMSTVEEAFEHLEAFNDEE